MPFLDFQIERSRKNLIKWIFLKGLSLIYTGLIHIWLAAYRYKIKNGWSAQVGVISIGNIAVGGTWGGQKGIDDTIFPQKFYIDYVRVFKKK